MRTHAVLAAAVLLGTASASSPRSRMGTHVQARPQPAPGGSPLPSSADCDWKFYEQPLSHFAEGSTVAGNATFRQRVCVIDKYWKRGDAVTSQPPGPILF